MPIYEYECRVCGHCFERLVFAGENDQNLQCPACGTPQVRKLVSCASTLSGTGGGLCASAGTSRLS